MNNKPIRMIHMISIFFLSTLVCANREKNIDVEVHIPIIQKLSIVSQNNFPELTSGDLNTGYVIVEDCLELEIKSNTGWSLLVINGLNNIENKTKILLRSNNSKFEPISNIDLEIEKSSYPTSSTIINIDCKRLLGWQTTRPQRWDFSPNFKIMPVQ